MTETKKAKGGNQIIRLALILFLVSARRATRAGSSS